MKITRITITNLFDHLNYDIPLANSEDLLILTAPNGFGKTMILNIIYSLFNKEFYFFQKLVFENITVYLDNDSSLSIDKWIRQADSVSPISIFFRGNGMMSSVTLSGPLGIDEGADNFGLGSFPITNDDIDYKNGEMLTPEAQRLDHTSNLPEGVMQILKLKDTRPDINNVLTSLNVYLIKEHRLFKGLLSKRRSGHNNSQNYPSYSIQEYAVELSGVINHTIQQFFQISQGLDSSFLKRLLDEKTKYIAETEFARRIEAVHQKQAQLKTFGLSESEQEIPTYDPVNAKLLLVYLNDTEQKLQVFADLIQHLALFTSIINERRFTFKTIKISKEKGFYFVTKKDKELNLADLSSGEQHEVVLLYELLFRAKPNTLVLIDEPEISLHITWQKEFLNDLKAIIQLRKMQVVVATHSPQIINDRWDLVFNLETQEMQ